MFKKVLSSFSNSSLLVSCVLRNNKCASFVALIKRTKSINTCVLLFFLLFFSPCARPGYCSCSLLYRVTRAFKIGKCFISVVYTLWCLLFFCQLLSVLLILSEQSHDGSRSFLSGNKEFGGHSCICMIEVVFLCCMYKQSRVLFLPTLSPQSVLWSSCSVSQDLFAVL